MRRWRLLLAVLLVVAVAAGAALAELTRRPVPASHRLVLGVLEADPTYLAADTRAGVRLAVLNLDWSTWEPGRRRVDHRYVASVVHAAAAYRAAGWQVAVDPGLQQPPGWAFDLPAGHLRDQHGRAAQTADFEFSAAVRAAAAAYLAEVVRSLGPVAYYRVGLSEHGEAHYPDTTSDQWWAYTPAAQGRDPSALPAGQGPAPLPGWVPGQPRWHGRPVTAADTRRWYAWYLGAMVDAQAWEISAYRRAGYRGSLELVMPGYGALPSTYQAGMADQLSTPGPYDVLATGAVWWALLDRLPSLSGVVVDVSSVGDGSGAPPNNVCRPGDRAVPLTSPSIADWSDTRWLVYLARRHHLPAMGENPGNTPASDLPAIFGLAEGCHLLALQWAWDYQLHTDASASSGSSGSPTADLAQLAAAYAAAVRTHPVSSGRATPRG